MQKNRKVGRLIYKQKNKKQKTKNKKIKKQKKSTKCYFYIKL
jgi:hypothetical protein